MFECFLFVVILGLRLKRIGDGDDSIGIVFTNFKIASFDILVATASLALIVLKATLVFLLCIVIGEMDAGEYEVGVVF